MPDNDDPQPSPCSLPSHAATSADAAHQRSEDEWRARLDPEAYRVLRLHGTEPPFRNAYWNNKTPGLYQCAGCQAPLFSSQTKFDSGTGWPSFYAAENPQCVAESVDTSYGMRRVEVHCSRCGGHLGHLFPDGPKPTGLRYCINSASLTLLPNS